MRRSDLARVALGLLGFLCVGLHGGRAHAYCRTTTVGVPADYNPEDGSCWTEGLPLYWQNACVGYSIQQNASVQVSYDDAKDAISEAFSKWTSATCTTDGVSASVSGTGSGAGTGDDDDTESATVDAGNVNANGQIARVSIDVRDLGPVECDEVTYSATGPNQHVILFRDDSWPHNDSNNTLALTTVVFNPDTGELYDADMEINTAQQKVTLQDPVPPDGYDFQSIVTHETGHFLGMAHSTDDHATMFAHYDPGQTTLRHLTFDDLDGICNIYPPNGTRNTGIGVVPQLACDPTPRHGFSTTCTSSGGCSVGTGRTGGSGGDGAVIGGGLALTVLASRRRRRRARP
jgi:hypothetical protein